MTRNAHLALTAALLAAASPALAQTEMHDVMHPAGATLLRFNKGPMHFALVLDAPVQKTGQREAVTTAGKRVDFRWSGRSVWINEAKFELPYGTVFLVSAKDSVRTRQLEFKAVRSRVLLGQAMAAPEVASWVAALGDSQEPVIRQDIEASTTPRFTLEAAEWKFRGVYAYTSVLSGAPHFVLISDAPISTSGSSQTTFGGFDHLDAWIGQGETARMWKSRRTEATLVGQTFTFDKGRVFIVNSKDGAVQQVDAPLELGLPAAAALAGTIEQVDEVRAHLGLEDVAGSP